MSEGLRSSESGDTTNSITDVFDAADLLPLISFVCERNGTEVNVFHDRRHQKTAWIAWLTTFSLKPDNPSTYSMLNKL